ncbi:MAG: hypothetical protein WD896_02205 [Parcubacteria group bacterium]
MLRNQPHANLLIGASEEAEVYLRALCDNSGIKIANNPDFFIFQTEIFGIDEARQLSTMAARKALGGAKIFLLIPARLTLEAQNALLKTFEDPFPNTYFFLGVREEGLVIPTLRSRMQTFRLRANVTPRSEEAEGFLTLSIKERLLFAKSFAEGEKDLTIFLDDLLLSLRKQNGKERLVESVYNVRRLVHDSAVAPRLVIEHLSLVL